MSTLERQQVAREPTAGNGYNGFEPRIFLQPIAAPSILGLFARAGLTLLIYGISHVVLVWLAGRAWVERWLSPNLGYEA